MIEIASFIICILLGMIYLQLQAIHRENRRLLRAIAMMVSMTIGPVGQHPDGGMDPDIDFAIHGGSDARRP